MNAIRPAQQVLIIATLLALSTLVAADDNHHRRGGRINKSGTLQLGGCTVDVDDLKLEASPISLAFSQSAAESRRRNDGDGDDDDQGRHGPPQVRAQIRPTANPHVFNFRLHALDRTRPYTLTIAVKTKRCNGKIVWIGNTRGVFDPNQSGPLSLKGFLVTTQIEIQTTGTSNQPPFVGADALSLGAASRGFRWRSDIPGAAAGDLQIATDRFPSSTDSNATCMNPPGLVFHTRVSGGPGWNFIAPLNFDNIFFAASGLTSGVRPSLARAIQFGAPIYVRVVPLASDSTPMCNLLNDGAAGIALLDYLIPRIQINLNGSPLLVSGSYTPAQPVETRWQYCLTATKLHHVDFTNPNPFSDVWGFTFASVPGMLDANNNIVPGKFFCWTPAPPSLIDEIGDFITGIVSGIGALVDDVAKLYDDIKKDLVQFVGSAVSSLGIIDCGDGSICQDVINDALSTAMAAAGLPPSLPTFSDLANQGLDYLAGEIADQTGIPQDVIDDARQIAQFAVDNMASAPHGGSFPDWAVPDNRFRPSQLTLQVLANPFNSTGLPSSLLSLPTPFELYKFPIGTPLPVSTLSKLQTITIPIQLPPDFSAVDGGQCLQNLNTIFSVFQVGPPHPPDDLVLNCNLQDWYDNHFQPTACTNIEFDGEFGFTQKAALLGTHSLVTLNPAAFPATNSNTCQ